jgi:hypothetical protein
MVIVHIVYDWAIPFVPKDFHALFASSWNATLFGYIAIRLIDDAINREGKESKAKWAIGAYFFYRGFINVISFLQSFELEGSWKRYKVTTSNYYADALIWSIIALILVKLYWKDIYKLCRKRKTI